MSASRKYQRNELQEQRLRERVKNFITDKIKKMDEVIVSLIHLLVFPIQFVHD